MALHNDQSGALRLFRSEALERLSVVSLTAFCATWAVALPVIAFVGLSTAGFDLLVAPLFCAGVLVWSLFEYAMHRFAFHWSSEVAFVRSAVFVLHGNHHVNSNDPLRNLMPPIVSIPIAAAVWGLCVLALGASGTWLFLGFISGYVFYDVIHFGCHQWPMKGRIANVLKRHHMRHHHGSEAGNFAITTPLWDKLFGSTIKSQRKRSTAS
ncbi:sterol desaturase family protein [Novosphingobium olei]|uniref:sterol desaturase family protein n=1 Tax=Novosphingobium olei TaxID=2728851 RepID=UPI00308DEF5B|nr:sterol desaturase family protein [Novosphingobium olei]